MLLYQEVEKPKLDMVLSATRISQSAPEFLILSSVPLNGLPIFQDNLPEIDLPSVIRGVAAKATVSCVSMSVMCLLHPASRCKESVEPMDDGIDRHSVSGGQESSLSRMGLVLTYKSRWRLDQTGLVFRPLFGYLHDDLFLERLKNMEARILFLRRMVSQHLSQHQTLPIA